MTPFKIAAIKRAAPLTLEQRSRIASALAQTAATQQGLAGTLEKVQVSVPHLYSAMRICLKTLCSIRHTKPAMKTHACMHACMRSGSRTASQKPPRGQQVPEDRYWRRANKAAGCCASAAGRHLRLMTHELVCFICVEIAQGFLFDMIGSAPCRLNKRTY